MKCELTRAQNGIARTFIAFSHCESIINDACRASRVYHVVIEHWLFISQRLNVLRAHDVENFTETITTECFVKTRRNVAAQNA